METEIKLGKCVLVIYEIIISRASWTLYLIIIFTSRYKEAENWKELCVLFALSRLPLLVLKLTHLWCQSGVFPLPRCHIVQHTLCAMRSEGPDMIDHLEREEAVQTQLFSQLWYAKHTIATPEKGPNSVALCLAVHMVRTQRSCSALMHWLWS